MELTRRAVTPQEPALPSGGAAPSTVAHTALLTERDFRGLLGGMCERKFKALQAAGVVPLPLELGPRVARWTREDFEETIRRLPRRAKRGEPPTLSNARQRRQAKSNQAAVAPTSAGGSQ